MIAFRVDGNSNIGMGHMSRCVSIYKELEKRGEECLFISSRDTDTTYFEKSGINVCQLVMDGPLGWSVDETISLIKQYEVVLLIIDSYRITSEDIAKLKKETRILYFDDIYNYEANADITINCNIDATREPYGTVNGKNKKVYTGVQYFPLRQDFFPYIGKPIRTTINNVLVSTGGTDPAHCSLEIIRTLVEFSMVNFHVLIGAYYPQKYIEEIVQFAAEHENIKIVKWGGTIEKTIANCDLVISSGSSTVFEALSIGVPCITFQFAENHRTECEELDRLQMAPFIGQYNVSDKVETNKKLKKFFQCELSYSERLRQYNTYCNVFDGKGLERIANIICGELNDVV